MTELTVSLEERSYPIRIGAGILDSLPEVLRAFAAKGAVAVVTDSNVAPLFGERVCGLARQAGLQPVLCVMPAGEEHKRLARIEELCGQFLEAGLDRSSLVIALGGGVVGRRGGIRGGLVHAGGPLHPDPDNHRGAGGLERGWQDGA
jgi:3-dehydroquinate synthase